MMKRTMTLVLALGLLVSPLASYATEGKVIAFNADCGYLLLETEKGYLFLKQEGALGFVPVKDEILEGFLIENYGINFLKRPATGEVTWVSNSSSVLSKDDAALKYTEACGPIETHPVLDFFKKWIPSI